MKILNQHEIQMISGGFDSLFAGCIGALLGSSQQKTILRLALGSAVGCCCPIFCASIEKKTPFNPDYFIIAKHASISAFQAFIGYQIGIFLKPEPARPLNNA